MKKRGITIMAGFLLLTVIALLTAIYINYRMSNFAHSFWIKDIESSPRYQVALVLGAKVYGDGSLSPILADRVNTGIELYKRGKVKKILFSGDNGQNSSDEVNAMKNYALAKSVPIKDIFLDHAGFRTYDSLYRAKEVFKVQSLVVVTQKFHLDRAIYIGRQLDMDVYGLPADKQIYISHKMNRVREFMARVKAFMELHLFPHQPKFLGPIIDITGDGRQSHD